MSDPMLRSQPDDMVARAIAPGSAAAHRARASTIRRRPQRFATLLNTGRVLTVVGLIAVAFIGYEFLVTGLAHNRAQRTQLAELKRQIPTTTLDLPVLRKAGEWDVVSVASEGTPVALLDIPKIGLKEVVVEGTNPEDLKAGPGHFRASPLPGEFGNAVIAGRRTTYGGPLRELDRLRSGDPIRVTTGQGTFVYVVSQKRQVRPGQADPLTGTLDSRLTLVTSDPAFLASGRLVLVAKLKGAPFDVPNRPQPPVATADLGLSGDSLGLPTAALCAQLLAVAIWLTWRLRRRWPRTVVYLFATPTLLALAVLTFTSLDRILPGTL